MVLIEKAPISLKRNDYEPDICFFEQGVAHTFDPDQQQFSAPQLIVEILSPSTAKRDRTVKFEDYQAHGIKDYWIVDADYFTVE